MGANNDLVLPSLNLKAPLFSGGPKPPGWPFPAQGWQQHVALPFTAGLAAPERDPSRGAKCGLPLFSLLCRSLIP